MTIRDHGVWENYTPASNAIVGVAYCRRVGDGRDWYEYIKDQFEPDTVKCMVEISGARFDNGGPVIRVPVVEADRLFPAGCRVIELTDVKRGQDEKALIKEFANRHIDLRSGTLGKLWKVDLPPLQPDPQILAALDAIMARLDKLERKD